MKFTLSKDNLEDAAKLLVKVINPKNTLPILASIKCAVNESERWLTMTASDGEMWLTKQVPLDTCEGGGDFCVPARSLADSLAEIPGEEIEIVADTENGESAHFTVSHLSGKTEFPLQSADIYPDIPDLREDADAGIVILPHAGIRRATKRTLFAIAQDDLRPVLTGVYFNLSEAVLDIVGTDGRRLLRNRLDMSEVCSPKHKCSFIIPKKVSRLLPEYIGTDEECDIMASDKMVSMDYGNLLLTFVQIEGKYPNYNSVIPNPAHIVSCNRQELLRAVRNVTHFAPEDSCLIVLNISKDKMSLESIDYDYSSRSTDSLTLDNPSGVKMKIGVKGSLLAEILQQIAEDEVSIGLTDPSHAMTLTPKNSVHTNEESTFLLMPMMMSE